MAKISSAEFLLMELLVGLPILLLQTLLNLLPVVGTFLAGVITACGVLAVMLWANGKGISMREIVIGDAKLPTGGTAAAKQILGKIGLLVPALLIFRVYAMSKIS